MRELLQRCGLHNVQAESAAYHRDVQRRLLPPNPARCLAKMRRRACRSFDAVSIAGAGVEFLFKESEP